ncbi:hypothetical protein Tco_1088564 [Tanacetum coccineum]
MVTYTSIKSSHVYSGAIDNDYHRLRMSLESENGDDNENGNGGDVEMEVEDVETVEIVMAEGMETMETTTMNNALSWCNAHKRTTGIEAAYPLT